MSIQEEKIIRIYADWADLPGCRLMGMLSVQRIRGHEVFSFEFSPDWLRSGQPWFLDPNLALYQGRQFAPENKPNFGLFLDSSPDRWGRMLMRRREAIQAKAEDREEQVLSESDYLLGVFDGNRMGALRMKLDPDGEFLDNRKDMASPPWTSLRELEHASLQLERDDALFDPDYLKWLNLLVVPGSSLGGARPKASVVDTQGNLWIAKFPSTHDGKNSGAWEMVLNQLAKDCGISVPESRIMKFSSKHHTYLSRRFDRTPGNRRIHFASAMTLLGYNDGADHMEGVSYLDLATFILQQGADVVPDLDQLWRRILFNVMVSNTDDHLRNHGFLLTPEGWRLSPAYDMNPDELGNGLTLNITDTTNEQDISFLMEVAPFFKINEKQADRIAGEMTAVVKNWERVAKKIGIGPGEIELTRRAFRLAGR